MRAGRPPTVLRTHGTGLRAGKRELRYLLQECATGRKSARCLGRAAAGSTAGTRALTNTSPHTDDPAGRLDPQNFPHLKPRDKSGAAAGTRGRLWLPDDVLAISPGPRCICCIIKSGFELVYSWSDCFSVLEQVNGFLHFIRCHNYIRWDKDQMC